MPTDELMSMSEVAQMLGRDIDQVRHLVYRRALPAVKVGRRLMFEPEAVRKVQLLGRGRPRRVFTYEDAMNRCCRSPRLWAVSAVLLAQPDSAHEHWRFVCKAGVGVLERWVDERGRR